MDLRDYQREAVEACFDALRRGVRAPLIVVPTGGGKSAILGQICRDVVDGWGARCLVATHRKELIAQDEQAILRVWPEGKDRVGVYSAGLDRKEIRSCTVAGVQSVWRRTRELGHVDVVIIDEAHLVSPKGDTQYGKLLRGLKDANPDLVVVGLTATPYRLGQGLLTQGHNKIFEMVCYDTDIKRLIGEGYLSPLVSSKVSTKIDTDGLRVSGGDFVLADLELAADIDEITESVARDIAETRRKSVLVFGVSVAHAARLRNAIRMQGISCETVVGETPNRSQILDDFKAGRVQCITSCDVLTTGFDAPNVDCLAIVRATMSPSLYVQICGRGSRIAPGKTDCVVLDYGGNIARHGPIDEVKVKAKGAGDGNGKAPFKVCPSCKAEVAASSSTCEFCDFEFPPPAKKANSSASRLDVISGEKKEPVRYAVDSVTVEQHTSKKSGKRMLRVSYFGPASRSAWDAIASDFVCIEHDGFARIKAEQWWSMHADREMQCPKDVDEALGLRDYLKQVVAISTIPDGKYRRVTSYEFARMREPGEDDDDEEMSEETDATTKEDQFWSEDLPW